MEVIGELGCVLYSLLRYFKENCAFYCNDKNEFAFNLQNVQL